MVSLRLPEERQGGGARCRPPGWRPSDRRLALPPRKPRGDASRVTAEQAEHEPAQFCRHALHELRDARARLCNVSKQELIQIAASKGPTPVSISKSTRPQA